MDQGEVELGYFEISYWEKNGGSWLKMHEKSNYYKSSAWIIIRNQQFN